MRSTGMRPNPKAEAQAPAIILNFPAFHPLKSLQNLTLR